MVAAHLDPHRIENLLGLGMPDVNYTGGWIELKCKHEWPVRPNTPLRIDHFTPEQRVWLSRRWRMGGNAFLLLCVGQEFLLYDGETARTVVGRTCRLVMYDRALARSAKGFDYHTFIPLLKTPR